MNVLMTAKPLQKGERAYPGSFRENIGQANAKQTFMHFDVTVGKSRIIPFSKNRSVRKKAPWFFYFQACLMSANKKFAWVATTC